MAAANVTFTSPASVSLTANGIAQSVDPTLTLATAGSHITSFEYYTSGLEAGETLTTTVDPPIAVNNTGISPNVDRHSDGSGVFATSSVQAFFDSLVFRSNRTDAHTVTLHFLVQDYDGTYSGTGAFDLTLNITPAPPPPVTATAPATASTTAGLPTALTNLIRAAPNSADAAPGTSLYTQVQAGAAIQAQYDAGKIFIQDAQLQLYHLVDGTTSLAEISYDFFTGATPTAEGLNYLVHSAANPSDLNDPYFQSFNTDNRYINFAVNLGTGGGAGAAAFNAAYGALSLSDAAAKAYAAIFGTAPAAGKITAILNELVPDGLGGTETRAQYLSDVSGGTAIAQKAALVGFFLSDSVREGGTYATADLHFLADLAHGTAVYNTDLLVAYGPPLTTVGAPVADPSVPH